MVGTIIKISPGKTPGWWWEAGCDPLPLIGAHRPEMERPPHVYLILILRFVLWQLAQGKSGWNCYTETHDVTKGSDPRPRRGPSERNASCPQHLPGAPTVETSIWSSTGVCRAPSEQMFILFIFSFCSNSVGSHGEFLIFYSVLCSISNIPLNSSGPCLVLPSPSWNSFSSSGPSGLSGFTNAALGRRQGYKNVIKSRKWSCRKSGLLNIKYYSFPR